MMRALTIKQPWADYVVTQLSDGDYKDVENRSWTTSYRGPLLIHAGASWDRDIDRPRGDVTYSAILGVVDLVNVHSADDCGMQCSVWCLPEPYHWELKNPRAFERPVPCSGALQVWNTRRLLPIIEQEIEHQMALIGVRA